MAFTLHWVKNNALLTSLNLIVPVVLFLMNAAEFKRVNQGKAKNRDSFVEGMKLTIVLFIVNMATFLLNTFVFNTGAQSRMIEMQKQKFQNDPHMTDMALEQNLKMTKLMMSPQMIFVFVLAPVIFGVIMSIVSALIFPPQYTPDFEEH